MHIPDGFLNAPTWGSLWFLSAGSLWYCIGKSKKILSDKMIPLMGIMSAFVFAAQMLNFPVAGGTSGHLLGGVLVAILLGPYVGAIVLSCVLIVQCLIFQDGGITALGANIWNMSFIGLGAGYTVFQLIYKSLREKGIILGAAVSAWFSVVLAATFCAVELAVSGTAVLQIVLPAMIGVHALIGIGEAAITVIVVGFVLKVRPDLLYILKE